MYQASLGGQVCGGVQNNVQFWNGINELVDQGTNNNTKIMGLSHILIEKTIAVMSFKAAVRYFGQKLGIYWKAMQKPHEHQ